MRMANAALHRTLLLAGSLLLAACEGGDDLRGTTGSAAPLPTPTAPPRVAASALIPGGSAPVPAVANPYWRSRDAIRDGQRLYDWYNCSGCHAGGGGGMGPPLMDDQWIYGSLPVNLFDTIVEGRPGGMPAFGGKIPEDQIWKIVAYVASMSGSGGALEVVDEKGLPSAQESARQSRE